MNIKTAILNNLKYKIIVVVLAILVWFFVKTEDNYRYSFNIPLRLINLGQERIVLNEIPDYVETTFWGKGRTLFSLLLRRDVIYNLDVADIMGKSTIVLDKSKIRMLRKSDVDVVNIVHPKDVEIVISKLYPKKVPVVSLCEIETAPGYKLVETLDLNPDSVLITGPETEIQQISAVFTEEKKIQDVRRDFGKKLKLQKPGQKHVTLKAEHTRLSVNVQKLMEKPLSEIPVKITNSPKNTKVTVIPSTLSLILEGGTDHLLNITKADITAYIDYNKAVNSKEKKHPAYIETPPGIRYRNVKPMLFRIVLEREYNKK